MQAGGATMMLAAPQPPPPSLAVTSSLVAGGHAPSGQASRPLLTMTQPPPQSPGLCHHQSQHQQQQVIHSGASAQPTFQQQTPILSRSISSTSVSPHHQPTSAVSAVTEMLKRKLQQRLLAETAKKRCLLVDGTAALNTDGKQSSQIDGTLAKATQMDFCVNSRSGSVSVTSAGVQMSSPHLSAPINQHSNVDEVQPALMTVSSAQRSPFRASLAAMAVSSSAPIAACSTQPNFPCVFPPQIAGNVMPVRKPKKKFKRKTAAAKAQSDKAKLDPSPAVTGSNFVASNPPTAVSGALFAGSCAPILTLPTITQSSQAATTSSVTAAMAAAVFGCRKLCGTSVGNSNGTANPMMFVGTSGMPTGFCPTLRCPGQPQMSRPVMMGQVNAVRSDNGFASVTSQATIGSPVNPSKPPLSAAAVSVAVWNSAGCSTLASDSALPESQSRSSSSGDVQAVGLPVLAGSISTKKAMPVGSEHRVDESANPASASGCDASIGINESKSFVSCYKAESSSIAATTLSSGDSIEQLQIANACRGGSFAQSTSVGLPFYIRSSGADVSASGSPARVAGVTMAIAVSGAASPSKTRKTAANIGLVATSLSGARVGPMASTSAMSPVHASAVTSPFASTTASKTPNKIIKFHEYKGPPGVASSSSSSSMMTSSHVSSSVISISSISWAGNTGNNVTLGMPVMSFDSGSLQQQSRMPLPPMQFLVQPNFSTSPSPSAAARVLKFDCRNPALPTVGTSFTPMMTTTATTTTVRPLMTLPDRPRDPFSAGVLVTLPTPVTTPAASSPVDEHSRIGSNPMVNGGLSADSSSLVSGRNSFPVGSELLPIYQASATTQLPRVIVGWSSPRCTASDNRLALGDAVSVSAMSSPNVVTPAASSVVSALHLTSSPHARLRLLPLDGYGAETQGTSCPVTSESPLPRPPSVNQQSSSDATSSSPVVAVKLHPRSTEQQSSKASSSIASSPSSVPAHLEDVRVADLKAECRKRCLAVSGPKPNLIARLKPYADEILVRLAAVIAGNADSSRHTIAEETVLHKDLEMGRSSDVNLGDNTLGVPPPVSGAVLDTSFHPLLDCSSSPLPVSLANQLQSPIKALFSPSRQISVSSPVRRIDHVFPVSLSSVVSSLFKSSNSLSSSVSPAVDADAVSPLVRRLFQTQASVFQPSIAANAAASIAVGGLLSNTGGVRQASEPGSQQPPASACGFHYRNPNEIAAIAVRSSRDTTIAQPLVGSHVSSQEFSFGDIDDGCHCPNLSTFRGGSVAATSNTRTVTPSAEISEGISFDLSSMFCGTSATNSSSANVDQLDMIDDVDDSFQREFDAIGAEYLADSESRAATATADNGLDEYLTGAASIGNGLTSSVLSTTSMGAPNAATMSPEELLDWQRRQIRELQSLLEQSRMELMETQVKVQRKSLIGSVCHGPSELVVAQSSMNAYQIADNNVSIAPLGGGTSILLAPSSIQSPQSNDVTNGSTSSPPLETSPSLECVVKPETDESFFVPVPLREPPKYDDVVRNKQHIAGGGSSFMSDVPPSPKVVQHETGVGVGVGSVEDLLDFLTSQRDILMETRDDDQPHTSSVSGESSQRVDQQTHLHHDYYHQYHQNQSNPSPNSMEYGLQAVLMPSPLNTTTSINAVATRYSGSYASSSMSYSPSSAASSSAADYDTYLQQSSDSGNGSCISSGGGAPWSVAPSSVDADEFMADHFSSSSSVGCAGDVTVVASGSHSYRKDCGDGNGIVGGVEDRDWTTAAVSCGETEVTNYQLATIRPMKTETEFRDVEGGGDRKPSSSAYGCSDPCLSAGAVADNNEDDEVKTEGCGSVDEDTNGNDEMMVDDCLDFADLLDIIMPPPAVAASSASRGGFSTSGMGDAMLSSFGRLPRSSTSSTSMKNVIDELFDFDDIGDSMDAFGIGNAQLSLGDGGPAVTVADSGSCPFDKVLLEAIASSS